MAPSKTNPPPPPDHHFYTPLPPHPPQNQNFTILSYFYSPTSGPNWRIIVTLSLLLLAALVYIFWPSDPIVKVERLHLTHIQVHTKPCICLDISMNVTLKVHNVDVYSMDYKTLDVAVGYRGKRLGHVKSHHGHVRALGSSYVEAELELECVKVLSDVVFLLEDLARGAVPIDTVTEFSGHLGIFFFGFPLKQTKVSCEVVVNTTSQTIARQNCYTE
ncbi:uncharacterized protein LOC123210823 isoform X1 [Mangifera indica]|uniref:uncharacterized protein LOC123210823 isoform X1 n=1 Tax=Mangifera indica TaxID=29780 RepID=UPI001CF96B39|nr:uncharacterized protein LOC123210823 isoform X1 [Mangifera indica]